MNQKQVAPVGRIPTHPVIAAAIAAYDSIKQWADGMLIGHTDFNKIFYEIINLLGKIKAGNSPDEVTKAADALGLQLSQLSEFFEQSPYNVKSFDELKALGVELEELRKQVTTEKATKETSHVTQISVPQQDLSPILQAIAEIGSRLDVALLDRVNSTPVQMVATEIESDSTVVVDDVEECTEILAKYREWLRSVREFETDLRDKLAILVEHQEGLRYGVRGVDRSGDILNIEHSLNGLVETRRPAEKACRKIEAYIAAWKIVYSGLEDTDKHLPLPAMRSSPPVMVEATKEAPNLPPVSLPAQSKEYPEKQPEKTRDHLANLGECIGANPAEVFYVTLFELLPRGRGQAGGYRSMIKDAFALGFAQKYGWTKESELDLEYQSVDKEESHVRNKLLRMNGAPNGTLVLSRDRAYLLPWAVGEVFTDEEVDQFKNLIELKKQKKLEHKQQLELKNKQKKSK